MLNMHCGIALESSIRECCSALTSVRATDRKKNGEILKNFLMGNSVPELLSENTLRNKGYTWNDLFDDIGELIIKETEKYETSKTFETVTVPLCSNLLHLCVSGSIKGKAYIKCDKLMDACLFILRDKRLTKAIGDSYLNLLYKYVLGCNHFLNNITPTAWEELLDVCLSTCTLKNSKLDNFTKLRLLLLVIRNSRNCCQFVTPLRDSIAKLRKCIHLVSVDKKIQEIVMEILSAVVETLSVESRLTMCELTEEFMSLITKFYDQNLDQKKKSSLFKLLKLILAVHHPLGKTQRESGSLAKDWDVWNKHLNSILEIVCLEVNFWQKQRKQDNLAKYCNEFYDVAASVYFQVFNLSVKREQEDGENTPKRQRVNFNKNHSFSDLIKELQHNHVPWLAIVHVYIQKFGQSILAADYLLLLSALEALVVNNNILHWDIFEDTICKSIKNLQNSGFNMNEDHTVIMSIWNSCVRTSTVANAAHKPLHSIMQLLLDLDIVKYQNVQPLLKLYHEKGMPVTDHSLKTLNIVFHKFFSKCSNFDERVKWFSWLVEGSINTLNVVNIREFLLRLLAMENPELHSSRATSETENKYDVLLNSVEKSILLSEFEIDVSQHKNTYQRKVERFELNSELNDVIKEYFENKLTELTDKLKGKDISLFDYTKFIHIVLDYLNIMLKNNFAKRDEIERGKIFRCLKIALLETYNLLTINLKSSAHILEQVSILKQVTEYLRDYDTLLSCETRRIPAEFFETVNVIVNRKILHDDGEVYEEDETVSDPQALKHACVCVLAVYCREQALGRNEILNFILDPDIYNFSITHDVDCALECIKILSDPEVEDVPLASIFFLVQGMCKELFKNSAATLKLLRVFLKILDKVWHLDNGQRNCCILVRGYLQRCEKKYYPVHVATLIYECAARIVVLELQQNDDPDGLFMEAVKNKVKGEIHSLRLYNCYLLTLVVDHLSDHEIVSYLESLSDIFVVQMTEQNDTILKDESVNRTLTILHSVLALVQTKPSLLNSVVKQVIHIQKEKNLDKPLVKKVLTKMISIVTNTNDIEKYFNDSVLTIINFVFSNGHSLDDIPVQLFGFENLDGFVEKHLKWLIPADILWRKEGVVKNSDVLKMLPNKSGKTVDIIEICICNIIVMCLPYIVAAKDRSNTTLQGWRELSIYAENMLSSTREMLGPEKWSTLFAENMSQLVVLLASHLSDPIAAKSQYNVDIPLDVDNYHYPKKIFDAILSYMGILIEENFLTYLCENHALIIFKALFRLWTNVLNEKVFEYKVSNLHSYVVFLESIPLGYPSDAFVCNFACNSVTHAVEASRNKKDLKVFVKALRNILERLLPSKAEILRKPISRTLSILMVKKEEGFESECAPLLDYLTCDMKECLKESEDVIDFISSLSQSSNTMSKCASAIEFEERLKNYKNSLSCPSHETLSNMRQFLKINKHYVRQFYEDLNPKGFSDECGTSIIHQTIYSLGNSLKSASDDKTIIEACNCMMEVGNYDLKTLVTVPPANTERVVNFDPKQYFAIVTLSSLKDILFDENPMVTNAVSKTLKRLLQYREGKIALDLENVDKDILVPLLSSDSESYADFLINDVKFKALCLRDLWVPKSKEIHSQWLLRITTAYLDVLVGPANYLSLLQVVCNLKPKVCEKILSPLIGLLLTCSTESHINVLSQQVNQFFRHMWDLSFERSGENSEDSVRNINETLDLGQKIIAQHMLNLIHFIRLQKSQYRTRPGASVESWNYLRIDYEKVAWVATMADQSVAAIYYGELWAAAQNEGVPPASPDATTLITGGENVQKIFRKCYVSIGEMDAIDGCGTAHLTSEGEKRKHLLNTSQYIDALLLHDIALSCGGQVDRRLQYGVVKSLHKSGMHHLALQYIKSLPENDDLNDIKYECLSFLGDWSDFVDTRELEEKSSKANYNPDSTIKAYRYSCLKDCLNLQPKSDFEMKLTLPLNRAKRAVAKLCQNLNMENCQNVYKVLSKLHLFSDIEDYFSVRCNKIPVKRLLDQWQVENLPAFSDFKNLETLIAQRSLMLEHAAKTYHESLKNIVNLQLQYAEMSLSNDRIQMAQRLLAVVKKIHMSDQVALVDSQVSWVKGHKDIALSLLRNIVANPSPDVKLNAVSLRQYGIWMAESKRDNARDIIDKYLKKSLEVLKEDDHEETRLKVYYDIAEFADGEYKQVDAYMKSSIFEKKKQCIVSMKGTANLLRSTQQLSRDEKKALTVNDRFGTIDQEEVASIEAEKKTFLHLAMRYYLLSLKQCELNNLSVFRVISLWLDNPDVNLSDMDGGGDFEDLLQAIPSRKFITVLPQLAPRLTNDSTLFDDNLRKLLKRCAKEHPHHTLPILFSLKNSDKDRMILNAGGNVGRSTQRLSSQEPRIIAAADMISQLADEDAVLTVIISQMEKMCDAIISLANHVPKDKVVRQKIPAAERIHKLGHLDAIPVPICTIPVSVNCDYSNLSTLHSFDNYFELVGGINCPKKINCRSSDGRVRILLIKGEDDLRQDAVMQQVFNIVNTLLEKDPTTSRSKLLIRTYKVVPLSRRSGVLEWCEGTMPIGSYLTGNAGAHQRYRPQDISPSAARAKLTELHQQRRSNHDKLIAFLRILKNFRPVFHYFFTEHYLDPVTWYERRLAYTKSVASSSMVGYILGLGDRHVQNILIDKKTAEVIHIDFGIAFDQGRTLPTPETIPFRLTQDIVAGFGSSGVEGIFRRCCEKTMELLRNNQETLMTILEVLLCDPFYTWTVTSKQQNVSTKTRDHQSSGSDDSLAKRALLSVSSKLSGTEGGVAGGVAVPGQVARLIHCAMDTANLSRLFPGWQPFL